MRQNDYHLSTPVTLTFDLFLTSKLFC